jgi:nucleoside-diphosphate kinase
MQMAMERTFGMIKPNATSKNLIGKIISMVEQDGFKIVAAKLKNISKTEAEGFYAEHKERPFFGDLTRFMSSGASFLFVLEGENAVERYRKLMGATDPGKAAPGTIRKLYGESIEANSVHGSDSTTSAAREINYFFKSEL